MNDKDYEEFMEVNHEYIRGAEAAYDNAIEELEIRLKALEINFNRDYDFLSIGEARSLIESVIDHLRTKKIEMYNV
jgi:hypothetical protein